MPHFLSDLLKQPRNRSVYRLDGTLQAGTSLLEVGEPCWRSDICNPFFNPCIILSGTGNYVTTEGKIFRFGPGSLLIRGTGVFHHQWHDGKARYIDQYLALPAEFDWVLRRQGLWSPERPVVELGIHEPVSERFDELTTLLEQAREGELTSVMAEIFGFIVKLLLAESVRQPHYDTIVAAAQRLEHDFRTPFSLARAARDAGMTPSNFRRLFARYLHMAPAEYRRRKRIEKIRTLLTSTDLPLKDIADRTGFPDIYTFAHQFKRLTGTPPGEYRRRAGLNLG